MVSPSVSFMRSARIRAIASDGPPAANGTMTVMGCDGKLSARALPPNASNATSAARTFLRITPSKPRTFKNLKLQPRVVDRLVPIELARNRRQWIFKPCRAVEQHHAVIFRHATVGEALFVGGIGCRALRTQQQPFFTRDFIECSRNLLIRHRYG